jgi:hypothetical protein
MKKIEESFVRPLNNKQYKDKKLLSLRTNKYSDNSITTKSNNDNDVNSSRISYTVESERLDLSNSNRIENKPYSSIIELTCWCGHKRSQHRRNDYSIDFDEFCVAEACNCKRYFE